MPTTAKKTTAKKEAPAAEAEAAAAPASPGEAAQKSVRRHVIYAMAGGLVPVPVMDVAAITAVQLKLLTNLAETYEVPFETTSVKNVLGSLVGGVAGVSAGLWGASILKSIPVVGSAAGMVTVPIFAGASTYAVGKVFIRHFESGGTFLTFDANKAKSYYKEVFEEGKQVASELKDSIPTGK